MRLVADEMEKSSADKRVKFDQKLYEMALKLGLPVCKFIFLFANTALVSVNLRQHISLSDFNFHLICRFCMLPYYF